MILKILKLFKKHKIIAGLIVVGVIGGGYIGYGKISGTKEDISYITTAAAKGTLISSISGTGQVSASNQVDIQTKVSGDLVVVNFKKGDEVKANGVIAQIDSRAAARKVSEAQASLESAQLELAELMAPTDAYTLLQAENDLANAQDSLTQLKQSQEDDQQNALADIQEAEDSLVEAYEDSYNTVANAFLDLPDIVTGLNTILNSYEISNSVTSLPHTMNKSALINSLSASSVNNDRGQMKAYINNAVDDYSAAYSAYSSNFDNYAEASRYSAEEVIAELLEQTIETTRLMSDTVKREANMLDFWVEKRTDNNQTIYSQVTGYQSDLNSYTSQTNSHLLALLAAQSAIADYQNDISDAQDSLANMAINHPIEISQAERSIQEKQQKLDDLLAGADELEIKNKQISVQQKQNSLIEAQQDYANYFIKAPFDGLIASLEVAKGDYLGSNTTIASMITTQRIAEITLNEVDAAKVEVGQKVTLTFDAVEDLSISGQVVEVDTLGEVSQGVVSYGVKIAFDLQDERIKPGMSVSATVIIDSKQNVLLVPVSSIKTLGEVSYVEILNNGQVQQQTVTVGLTNDVTAEITDGLAEGDEVITQTSNGSASSANQFQGSAGGGNMQFMRIMR